MWKKRTKIFSRFVILFCITSSVGIKRKIVTMCTLFTVLICNHWNGSFDLACFCVVCSRGHTHLSYCCIGPLWMIKKNKKKTHTLMPTNKHTGFLSGWWFQTCLTIIRSLYVPYLVEEIHIWSVRYIFSFIFRCCIIEISIHTEHLWALTICLEHRKTVKTLACRDAACLKWEISCWLVALERVGVLSAMHAAIGHQPDQYFILVEINLWGKAIFAERMPSVLTKLS